MILKLHFLCIETNDYDYILKYCFETLFYVPGNFSLKK